MVRCWLKKWATRLYAELFLVNLPALADRLKLDDAQVRLLSWYVYRLFSTTSPEWAHFAGSAFISRARRWYGDEEDEG